tara:strand:- start:34 stop:483 length:450 start_codon:yes stop_codon:yes gene_type:complete
MKYLLLILLTLNLTFGFTQSKVGKEKIKTSTTYIIDESWSPRGATRWKADKNSYLQIVGDYFVLSERTRGKTQYFEGHIKSLVEKDGGIHFWVKSRGSLMMSFDIIPNGDNIRLHMYHSFGKYDKYYDAHLATQKEIQLLLEYGISISF